MRWLREEPQININMNGIIKWNGPYKVLHVSTDSLECELANFIFHIKATSIQVNQLDHQFLLLKVKEIKSIQLKEKRFNE